MTVISAFKFLHAADLHLDSPLLGLSGKSVDFAAAVEHASRRAFDNLVALAIAEQCRFVILAGDVFDGDLRDFKTGLYFLSGMRRLRDADIKVFLIAGNHDAENRFADKLGYSDNVHRFAHRKAETVVLDDIETVIHGRSFGQRDVSENLALGYPAPVGNVFNIGILHTACAGSEGHHALYAPCSLEQLINHGYHYWALGHVHTRAELNLHPHVIYPGNLQGRNPRETGPKGATLVEVVDGTIVSCVHRDLDEVRWVSETIDVSGAADRREILERLRARLDVIGVEAGDRSVALRLRLSGRSVLHGGFLVDRFGLRDDVEALLATLSSPVWLEKLDLGTQPLATRGEGIDPTVAGQLEGEIRRLGAAPEAAKLIDDYLAEIRVKMPAGSRTDELFDLVRAEAGGRAVEIAVSLVSEAEDARAAG
ncbi:metallophosphoesterase family protein [Lichenihabitans psoromatis]|uniref:metallophosphoesterase family protein n=1 Tax=Lichenihabitans psoromatis TaxID=2528642 RepID=UPI001FE0AA7F|nr:DNA repair exonuclease [Lichenihabitans psoromatis]